ncbi:hypothetical protein HanIR_Chr14g0675441 [Helianthus annuus]|nr:hypothetical protein HanIR_Chr14g0675441 [Helianthus annuus]KAJ0654863.1 hypothetical protein HanLR1_Chr14g0511971 [Helianthus annuus]
MIHPSGGFSKVTSKKVSFLVVSVYVRLFNNMKYPSQRVPNTKYAVKKIIIRTLKMLFWGIILQGGYSHAPYDLNYGVDMKKIRWCGILQVFLILPPSH